MASSPYNEIRPTRWLSPDLLRTGVSPRDGPTAFEFLKRAGTSTVLIKAKDTTGPTPGMVINRLGRCLLLPPAPFSRCGFPLSFLLLLMLLLAASCKSVLCPSVSLVGGELEEASGL